MALSTIAGDWSLAFFSSRSPSLCTSKRVLQTTMTDGAAAVRWYLNAWQACGIVASAMLGQTF